MDIAAFHPAELLESLVERGDPGLCFQVIVEIAHQHADTPYAFTLLRARRERPCGSGTAEQRDERAPPHGTFPPARTTRADAITFEASVLCITANFGGPCRLRVNSGPLRMSAA